jgi:hypothetical protein
MEERTWHNSKHCGENCMEVLKKTKARLKLVSRFQLESVQEKPRVLLLGPIFSIGRDIYIYIYIYIYENYTEWKQPAES